MRGERLAAAPLPQPHQSPQASRAKAAAILSQHQFQAARPNLFTQILQWIGQHLGAGAGTLVSGGWGALLGWVVLGAVLGIVVLIALYATRTLRRDPARPEAALRIEVHRSPTDWRREAEAFEGRGEWKEGLRCRYRALVAELIDLHVVLDLPGRTTGEYRGDVGATLPEAGPDFAGASKLFERAWYGDRATGPAESERFAQLSEAVLAPARRRRPVVELDGEPGAGEMGRQLVGR